MTPRVVVGIAALVCASICGMIATFVSFEMIDRVNEMLPDSSRFAWLGWYFSKTQRLHREYKKLYPDGRLLLKVRVLTAVMIVCGLVCAWAFGLFS